MPLLRKTGVRSPWMPAPLQGPLACGRQALVIAAIVPSVLLGGTAQFVGRPSRPENTQWPARPSMVVGSQPPIPGAFVWAPRPLDAGVVAPPDKRSPTAVQVGQQPVPIASFWMPTPAGAANTDPPRPLALVADPPDPTLAQPNTTFIGRLARDEDTSRPAKPTPVLVGAQPLPNARTRVLPAPRDQAVAPPDRLAPTAIITGAQPLTGATALFVGTVTQAPDRRAPVALVAGQQPVPGASAQFVGIVHDGDRLAPTAIITATLPIPGAATLTLRAPRDQIVAPPDRLSPPLVILVPLRKIDAITLWVGAVSRSAEADRPSQSPRTFVPAPQLPWGSAQWTGTGRDPTVPPILNPIICALATLSPQAKPSAVLAQATKLIAVIAPAARTATLTPQVKPSAALAQLAKPTAVLEQCRHG